MSKQEGNREIRRATSDDAEQVIPVVEEELEVGKERVATGTVQVNKRVEEQARTVEMDLEREAVEIRHVPINLTVGVAPPVRQDGDTLIVPVVEEELVVTKRLVLKEEIHITKRRTTDHVSEEVTVAREVAEVRRYDAEGRPLPE